MRKALIAFIQRGPLAAYFILAYAFAWMFAPLIAISPVYGIPGLFAPGLAGFIVSRVMGGRAQAGEYLGKLTIWRVHVVWYLAALGLPVALTFLVAVLGRFFDADPTLPLAPVTALGLIVFVLVAGEELGWRGFAQPQLEKNYSPLIAAIILGVLWGFWHLPNFFIPGMPHTEIPLPAFILYTTAFSVLAAWLLQYARGSVLIATLLHGASNTLGFLTPGLDSATRWWLLASIYCVAALLVVLVYGVKLHRARSTASLDPSLTASAPPKP